MNKREFSFKRLSDVAKLNFYFQFYALELHTMNTPVYAEKITSLSDARYFAGMGVRWLGVCVNPSDPAYLSPQRFREIAGWVAGPQFVLESEQLSESFSAAALSEEYGISCFRINPVQKDMVAGFTFGIDGRHNPTEAIFSKAEFLILESAPLTDDVNNMITLIPAPNVPKEAEEILLKNPKVGFIISGSAEAAVGLKEYDAREFLEFLDDRD